MSVFTRTAQTPLIQTLEAGEGGGEGGGEGHRKFPYCWFARDVTAAMLVVKKNSISLLWELKVSIFMQILQGNILLF